MALTPAERSARYRARHPEREAARDAKRYAEGRTWCQQPENHLRHAMSKSQSKWRKILKEDHEATL